VEVENNNKKVTKQLLVTCKMENRGTSGHPSHKPKQSVTVNLSGSFFSQASPITKPRTDRVDNTQHDTGVEVLNEDMPPDETTAHVIAMQDIAYCR